jgi:asparagine synthase (glutamine-hydrolysing)
VCGFSGEIDLARSRAADPATVARMTGTMASRGPDGSGLWAQGPVALGHRRLKIIDLSERAAQPLVDSELGVAVAFNGCIYNHRELRRELEGHGYRFFSTGDTEVIVKAYHRWGDAFVDRLVGMFALCLVERDSGRVVLARDRLGIKPLYLAEVDGCLRFASTLPALLAGGGVDAGVDAVALHQYLTFHSVVPAPRTILRGVSKLPPATVLVVEPDGRRHERTYWQAEFGRRPEHEGWDARDWQEAILAALRTAVERRMVADVPVGCLLSGGLDSSLVVGLLAEAGVRDLLTFSIGFESHGGIEGDEFRYSDVVAERFATDHHRIRVPSDRLLPALDGAVAAMSEPMVSHDAVAFYLLSEQVARHVRVVQSGQGADEVFAGYHWYPPMLADTGPDGGVLTYGEAFFDRPDEAMADVVAPAHRCADDAAGTFVSGHFGRPGAATPLDRALRLDTEVMLVDDPVKRVDNMTMAWGLEARVPFLDQDLVALAAACPPELKVASGGKGVLKDAARGIIPAEVIDRPKGYFPVPALTHLEGPLLDLVRDALTDPAAKQRGLFEPAYVEALLAEPNGGLTPLGGNKLWQLGLLELWLQRQGVAP